MKQKKPKKKKHGTKHLRIALGTPWLVRCGVSTYSYYLAHALARHGCEVYVVRLHRYGQRDENYFKHYAEEFPLDVDIIHLQHEYSLLAWCEDTFYQRLRAKMEFLGKTIPIVTTMHSTGTLKFDRKIRSYNQAVIVQPPPHFQ